MTRLRRSLAVLVLALALVPLPALAATTQGTSLLTSLWDWLVGLWADEGCGIDPGGWCAPPPTADEGCGLDPGGSSCPGRQ
jgi:hypothetical protein